VQGRVPSDHGTLSATGPAADSGITLQVLRTAFPEWRISRQSGAWWALRGGPVHLGGPESLLRRAVTACDLTGLAEKLCVQYRLDRLDPQELAAVYRDLALPAILAEPPP
jgi:hypothetical protein